MAIVTCESTSARGINGTYAVAAFELFKDTRSLVVSSTPTSFQYIQIFAFVIMLQVCFMPQLPTSGPPSMKLIRSAFARSTVNLKLRNGGAEELLSQKAECISVC